MIGLMLKDMISLKGFWRIVGILMLFFAGWSVYTGDATMMASICMMLCAMLPINAMAFDSQAKWDAYGCCLPLPRYMSVLAKYLMPIMLMVVALVVTSLVWLLTTLRGASSWIDTLLYCLLAMHLSLLVGAVLLPMLYRFGVEKARLLMMVLIMGAMLVITSGPYIMNALQALGSFPLWIFSALIFALYAGSFFLSKRIYEHKEF